MPLFVPGARASAAGSCRLWGAGGPAAVQKVSVQLSCPGRRRYKRVWPDARPDPQNPAGLNFSARFKLKGIWCRAPVRVAFFGMTRGGATKTRRADGGAKCLSLPSLRVFYLGA